MLIGTLGAEYQVKASTLGAPITPTNITILPQTNHGSLLECEPFRIGYAVVFVQRAGNKLIELTYEFTLDSYVGKDLSITSDHIMRQDGGAHRTAYAQEPNSIIWICLNDGTLASVTYEREQQVAAWQEHALGGIAHVESICSVSEGNVDILYMVVLRSIGGVQCRTIERLTPDFFPSSSTDRSGMWHLDCALQYVGVPVQTVAVGHLAVDPVTVVADGAVLPSAVIVAGVITLPEPASNVIVGYSYTGTMRVLPVEGQSPSGTQQGKIKRINKLTLRLWNSLEFKHGYDLNKLDVESFRDIPTGPMDASPPFFTGDRTVNTSMEYSRTGQFYIVQDHPYPLNLLAIVPQEGLYEQ
jgi:hypothetical protein